MDRARSRGGSLMGMKVASVLCPLTAMLLSCRGCPPGPADGGADSSAAACDAACSSAAVTNRTDAGTTVYASFGTNSQVGWWSFCADAGSGNCSFPLGAGGTQALPTGGAAANVTLAFDQAPSCNTTVAEFNFNVSGWSQDTANISLVNGWNHDVEIDVSGNRTLGPTQGADANAGVYGVYPLFCDVCVARQSPPCGIQPCGSSPDDGGQGCGCQLGSQYNPVVPCQESFVRGAAVTVALVR